MEVRRRDHMLGYQVFAQIREVALLQKAHDRIAIGFGGLLPVGAVAEVRHRRQDIKTFTAGRRQRGIGERRHVQVKRKIVRELLFGENIVQQRLVALAQNNIVMLKLGAIRAAILAVGAEVDHHQRHRVARARQLVIGPLFAELAGQQLVVGKGYLAIADHRLGAFQRAVG